MTNPWLDQWLKRTVPGLGAEWPDEDPALVEFVKQWAVFDDGLKIEGTPAAEWLARIPLERSH